MTVANTLAISVNIIFLWVSKYYWLTTFYYVMDKAILCESMLLLYIMILSCLIEQFVFVCQPYFLFLGHAYSDVDGRKSEVFLKTENYTAFFLKGGGEGLRKLR